jgi:hypothetical protein
MNKKKSKDPQTIGTEVQRKYSGEAGQKAVKKWETIVPGGPLARVESLRGGIMVMI